jgi:hypothetical protein
MKSRLSIEAQESRELLAQYIITPSTIGLLGLAISPTTF